MAAPVPVTSSPPATNAPPSSAAGGPAAAAAPARVAQRDGGNTSLGTFGVRLKSSYTLTIFMSRR
jgi:pyridoxal 5'-phosphate synthase pdxS subunit